MVKPTVVQYIYQVFKPFECKYSCLSFSPNQQSSNQFEVPGSIESRFNRSGFLLARDKS